MDTPEFTALLRRHAALIHKIACAYCRDVADREDLVQEIAVQLWRSRTRYDERYRHTTWIYRIALNVAISFYRRERRHRNRTSEIDEHLLVVEPAAPGGEKLPAALVGFEALTGVDALARVDLAWLIANLAFGACVLAVGQAWSRRNVERPGLGPRARRILDALSGRSLRSATSHLAELARFQGDEPPEP